MGIHLYRKGEGRVIETERLILRQWRESDLEPFAEMNADPKVMEHFPKCLSREESDASVEKFKELIEKQGWGLWAVELKEMGEFIVYPFRPRI